MADRTPEDDAKDEWVLDAFGVDPRDYDRTPPPIDPARLPPGPLNPADYQVATSRNRYLAGKYDPNSLADRALNLATSAMDNPRRILTDVERVEHHALSAKIIETLDPPPTPQAARLDAMEASPLGAIASLATRSMGGGQAAQDAALNLGTAADGVGLALAGGRAGPATRFLGMQAGEGVPVVREETNKNGDGGSQRSATPSVSRGARLELNASPRQRPAFISENVAGKLPAEWGAGEPTSKKDGWRWTDPTDQGSGLRVDPGSPASSWHTQQVDHVIVRSRGAVLGRDGEPITGTIKDNPVAAHIPLQEYREWRTWNHP